MLAMAHIYWVYFFGLMDVFLLCIHSIWMVWLFVLGSIHNSGGFIGFLYVMVSTLMCVMTWEFRKGPSGDLRLCYEFWSSVTSIVIESG